MKKRRTRRKQYRTVWHPIFYTLVRGTLPGIYRMLIELLLGEMPPRADLVIIRREPGAPPPDDELEELPALYTRLGEHTLVEFKGGTDRVEARDVAIVLGYANLYLAKHHLSLEQLRLIFVAPMLKESFLHGVEGRGGSLVRTEVGVWDGQVCGHLLSFLETEQAWKGDERNESLYLLTEEMTRRRQAPRRMTKRLMSVYYEIAEVLDGHPNYKESDMETQKKVERAYLRQMEALARRIPVKARLEGMSTRERLEGIPARERLEGIPVRERLEGIPARERLEGIPARERLEGIPARERLEGIPAEEVAKELPPEVRLKGLGPEDRLKGLGPEEREAMIRLLLEPGQDETPGGASSR